MRWENSLDRSEQLPARSVIELKLEDLLAGRISREEVAGWARPYALGEKAEREDPKDIPAWEALTSLAMSDTKDPDDGGYLYNNTSFRSWLEQLRASPTKPG